MEGAWAPRVVPNQGLRTKVDFSETSEATEPAQRSETPSRLGRSRPHSGSSEKIGEEFG